MAVASEPFYIRYTKLHGVLARLWRNLIRGTGADEMACFRKLIGRLSVPRNLARTIEKDIDDPSRTRFPSRQGRGVKDANKGAEEIVRVGRGTKFAGRNGTPHQLPECTVDHAARTLDQAH